MMFQVGILRLPSKKVAIDWVRAAMHRLDDGEPFPPIENYIIAKLYPALRSDHPSHFIVSRRHARIGSAPAICPYFESVEGRRRGRPVAYPLLFNPRISPAAVVDAAINDLRKEYREEYFAGRKKVACERCEQKFHTCDLEAHHRHPWTAANIRNRWLADGGSGQPCAPGSLLMVDFHKFRAFHDARVKFRILCGLCHRKEAQEVVPLNLWDR